MASLSTGPLMTLMLIITEVLGCGVMPSGQGSVHHWAVPISGRKNQPEVWFEVTRYEALSFPVHFRAFATDLKRLVFN
ncbi:hypothetical protein KIN20_017056 [Parelaphostrongylus tenuis]|uniref:Secreted protein n=1 Tax=Parelaphostrongylus tenuis TaxID=148309 RepID=A0AAD5QQD8_PARTN|nr:hypothetical protein KIN20_017056 [Parelaphostrongylus tenuis]